MKKDNDFEQEKKNIDKNMKKLKRNLFMQKVGRGFDKAAMYLGYFTMGVIAGAATGLVINSITANKDK